MDDDKKLKAEFPLGEHMIVVTEPSPGQLFALSLSRTSKDADRARAVVRVLKIMEALTGPEQWYGLIEDALISEEISPDQLLTMAMAVFEFPWAEHRTPDAAPDLTAAIEREEVAQGLKPATPQPRIIRG